MMDMEPQNEWYSLSFGFIPPEGTYKEQMVRGK